MDWKVLFDFRGRNNRQRYWFTILGAFGGSLAIAFLSFAIMNLGPALIAFVVPIVIASTALLGISLCNSVRRLHDLNRTGWWLLPVLLAAGFLKAVGSLAGEEGVAIGGLGSLISMGFGLAIGLPTGTPGNNRFGPSPIAIVEAAPVEAQDGLEGEELHYSGED